MLNDVGSKILSDVTVYSKYARYLEDKKRREDWEEIVSRNMMMHIKKYPQLVEEISNAYQMVYEKKVLPSMRSLQFGGKPIEVSPNRIYNCAYLPIDDVDAFSEVMFLLLGGSGVGFSVQKHHVDKLPHIQKPIKRKRRHLIGDSIEGWSEAIKILMKSYFSGLSNPVFDYSSIRPKGAILKTSGGRAPGPQPLHDCIHNIRKILDSKDAGDKLTPLQCHDILCYIADAVLSGGIRRSAMISLFSFDDEEMITSKYGSWYEKNSQRGRANNSAVALRHRIKKDDFLNLWKKIEQSRAGEPAIWFSNNADIGTNPCGEISLKSKQFCVSEDTKLITRTGISEIKNLVDKECEIWNGEKWSKVKPFQTGERDTLHRVYFSDGSYLDATDNHKFLVKNRFEKDYKEVETLELINLLKTEKYKFHIPRSNIVCDDGYYCENSYEYGFFLGDGYIDGNKLCASLYNEDKKMPLAGEKYNRKYTNWNGKEYEKIKFTTLDFEFGVKLKKTKGLPKEIFSWNKQSILNFIAGWLDADGSNASKGVRLYGQEDNIRDCQLLLTKVGINSSVNLMARAGEETNLGIRKKDVWYLQITKTNEIPSNRLLCENTEDAKCKGKYQIIKKIETLSGLHKSYCLTEDELNQCVFNNALTKQCNLCEINVGDIESQEDLNERAKVAAFIGTLQAGYTDFHFLRDEWKETTEKEALIGVGMTGIAAGKVLNFDLEEASRYITEENARVAALIGINVAARTTCVKPGGTSSCVLGVSSGIHAWHDKYYIRRIIINKQEPIYRYLMDKLPSLMEDSFYKPLLEAVLSLPIKAPKGSILRTEESAVDLLERVKKISIEWVRSGHKKGDNTNNVSCTVTVKDNEWKEVGEWMWRNRDNYNGLSVLPYDGGTYAQTPFESCSQYMYNKMVEELGDVKIDLNAVIEEEDNTDLKGEAACAGGQCSV